MTTSVYEGAQGRASGEAPVLHVDNVDLGYDELLVVMGFSLSVYAGELVGLVGGNGSGKSTILRAVSAARTRWRRSVSRTSRWGDSFFLT